MKILYVDDDPKILALLEEQLLMLGHETSPCSDAESALDACRRTNYDILILDMELPDMDGIQLCRELRRLPQTRQSLILFITGHDEQESLEAALEAGADDYLNKPVSFQQLKTRLTILERRLRDLHLRQQAEQNLSRQDRLLLGVAGAMNYLLVVPEFHEAIVLALKALSLNVDVDRIYIYETLKHPETHAPLMSQRFGWDRFTEEALVNDPNFQQIPYHPEFTRWYELLSSEQTVSGRVWELPTDEREILAAQNIISILIVPITIHDRFWGFIGFDDCHSGRQWRDEEELVLMAMAGSIGGALVREKSETQLRQAGTELREIFQALPDEYFRLGPDGSVLDYKVDKNSPSNLYSETFIGKWASGMLPDKVETTVEAAMAYVRKKQKPMSFEYAMPQGTQQLRYEEIRFLPFLDDQLIVVARDITKWKAPRNGE